MKLVWFLLIGVNIRVGAEPTIVVRPHTLVSQTKSIVLSDVADLSEIEPGLAKSLAELRLADGPKLGERLDFSGTAISAIVRSVPLWQKAKVKPQVTIPSHITVENVGDQVSEAQIRMELASRWQLLCSCRVQLDELVMPKTGAWVAGSEWKLNLRSELARGSFTVPLEIRRGENVRLYWIRGKVTYFKKVPVARRALNLGDRIQPEDLETAERDITFARDGVLTVAEIIGRKVKLSVGAQEIIFASAIEREKALKRGDVVKVSMGAKDWEVALMGVAEQDGNVGDTVRIRNPKSNQVVMATVIGRGEVQIQ